MKIIAITLRLETPYHGIADDNDSVIDPTSGNVVMRTFIAISQSAPNESKSEMETCGKLAAIFAYGYRFAF